MIERKRTLWRRGKTEIKTVAVNLFEEGGAALVSGGTGGKNKPCRRIFFEFETSVICRFYDGYAVGNTDSGESFFAGILLAVTVFILKNDTGVMIRQSVVTFFFDLTDTGVSDGLTDNNFLSVGNVETVQRLNGKDTGIFAPEVDTVTTFIKRELQCLFFAERFDGKTDFFTVPVFQFGVGKLKFCPLLVPEGGNRGTDGRNKFA